MKSGRQPAALVYGKNPVLEALRAGREIKRLVVLASAHDEPRLSEMALLRKSRGSVWIDSRPLVAVSSFLPIRMTASTVG